MILRRLAPVLAVFVLAGACTAGSPDKILVSPTSNPTANAGPALPVIPIAADPLCRGRSSSNPSSGGPSASLPASMAQIARQVEQIRNLTFLRSVSPHPVTSAQMAQLVRSGLRSQLSKADASRTSKAWGTIGAIPQGTDLGKAVSDLESSQVIGFYDYHTRRLVFIGSAAATPLERFTLSHELTHALDDQRFDLSRLGKLDNTCRDDQQDAYLALAEGDAVATSVTWARQDLSSQELLQLQQEAASGPSAPSSVPPFLVAVFTFPYVPGELFVEALLARGGSEAVNRAFQHPPISTEQILHPARYPSDQPVDVEVPNVASRLGRSWKEIEVQQVGEGWLQLLLALHLSQAEAAADTDHWGGGQYRAWSDGSRTVVVMDTVWDNQQAAARFSQGIRRWLGHRTTAAVLQLGPKFVRVLFASDASTLASLSRIAG